MSNKKGRDAFISKFREYGNICPMAYERVCDNRACKGTLKEFEACWKFCLKEQVVFT